MRERATAILKVANGQAVQMVASHGLLKQRKPETVSEWLDRYERAGLARSRWWLHGIRTSLPSLNVYTLSGLGRLLERWGLRYKRGRQYLHSPDADYALKMAYLRAAHQMATTFPPNLANA